jgi:flavorubredoxin
MAMDTTIDEINDGIFRISTFVAEVPPAGFGFNQFLVTGDEPLLFHAGPRGMFPLVAEAVASVIPVSSLRWLSFGHVESDESGAMNTWLAAAPHSQVVHGALACMVSLNDLCDRPPRPLADGEVLDIGGRRLRWIDTPHVPHGWEAGLMFEEVTSTLLCGDLLAQVGGGPALTSDDVVDRAMEAEAIFHSTALGPNTTATLRRLADLDPTTLAIMHGSSFAGDGRDALQRAAAAYAAQLSALVG